MAQFSLRPYLLVVLWLSSTVWAYSVEFFYNVEKNTCNWGTNTLSAHNNTANGGLCAYVEAIQRVYACPAPDNVCWTLDQTCNGKNGSAPGPNQIQCNRNGATWCCQNGETCSTTKNQINVCWGQFSNLNRGVQAAAAVSVEFSAIPSSVIATTAVTALPSVITTSSFGANADTSTMTTTTTGTSATSTASTGPPETSNPSSSKSLSGGTIAGIVIGVLVGVGLLIGAIIFMLFQRRRRRSSASPNHQNQMSEGQPFIAPNELYGSQPTHPDSKLSPEGPHEVDGGPGSSVSQLPSDGPTSTVTSGSVYSQPSAGPPVRYELQ